MDVNCSTIRFAGLIGLAGFVLAMAGCDGSPPATQRAPASRPTTRPNTPAPETSPAPPVETQPATEPATQPALPTLPEYLSIGGWFEADTRCDVRIVKAADRELKLETTNVRRLHIDRAKLPFDASRSIALRLDGQVMEWRANSRITDFERSPAGLWLPVRPEPATTRPSVKE